MPARRAACNRPLRRQWHPLPLRSSPGLSLLQLGTLEVPPLTEETDFVWAPEGLTQKEVGAGRCPLKRSGCARGALP